MDRPSIRPVGICQSGLEDPDDWFPDPWSLTVEVARARCRGCPVQLDCLEDALGLEAELGLPQEGIFGGLTPAERERIRAYRERVAWSTAGRRGRAA